MDGYSGKRGIDGVVVPRKGMGHVLRDTANSRDQKGQICSRLGCSGSANLPKVAQVKSSDKGKSMRSYSGSKEAIGSSSRTTSKSGKLLIESRKTLSSQFEIDSSETSSVQDEPEISELIPLPEESQRRLQDEGESTESSEVISVEVGSSNAVSNTRSQRSFNRRPGLREQENKSSVPVRRSGTCRYELRSFRCNSISDVIPAGSSSSDSTLNRKKDSMKKRNCEGESSSTVKGKKIIGSSQIGRNSGSRIGLSISDSRRSRNLPSHSDISTASVRTQKSNSGHARGRFTSQGNGNPVATCESSVIVPLSPHSDDLDASGISYHSSSETPFSCSSSYGRPGTSSEQLCDAMPVSPAEYDITHSLINWDGFQHYNMDGMAEQIILLENSLLLNGLNFYDHHRDMRMDIDNMSYEELLALEERMGTVSTALTEEALSECLKTSTYQSAPSDDVAENCEEDKDDIKCCICQEEYVIGDEVGSLQCKHRFHVICIQEWLRLKNWCPICKVSAALSNSSSLPH
ncbi:uncharacterized protein LOC113847149 isoform X2 [Abrus precatorius]|uniref:RING-type E3 ubiquitin transferase n=1 Tax=Abrus precatorius TaxID=3816 RepID=A0A8B8JK65_ABRPR|nr:uncharacterized protein LOC113847149 isoform X2 [Abrus precatorius]